MASAFKTLLASCLLLPSLSNAETYSFGIVPQQSASKLAALWVPILRQVSTESGHRLIFKTAKNIPEFEKKLAEGKYDFSYMNPYHYTVFHKSSNYNAILKAKDKRIKGIVVVKKNSPYKRLEDLNNQSIAFPSPAAFAATILTQSAFKQRKLNITPKYVSSHDSVYRNVAQGRLAAGGGVIRTFKNTEANIKDQLAILWTSDGFTPHAIAAHERVPSEDTKSIQKSFITLSTTDKTMKLLSKIKLKGLESAQDSDWNDIRELKIEILK
jgi:ABC-type phosphate/phosphonate transport system substrate-binding protein